MRALIAAAVLAASLSGCNPATVSKTVGAVSATDNALASLADNQIPKACGIIRVAEGYYHAVESEIPAKQRAIASKSIAVVDAICDNPPHNVVSAFTTLFAAWTAIQAATTVPPK